MLVRDVMKKSICSGSSLRENAEAKPAVRILFRHQAIARAAYGAIAWLDLQYSTQATVLVPNDVPMKLNPS